MCAMSDTRACSCLGSMCASLRMDALSECVPAVASAMMRMAAAAIARVLWCVFDIPLAWPACGAGTPVFGTTPSAMILRAEPPKSGSGAVDVCMRPTATSASNLKRMSSVCAVALPWFGTRVGTKRSGAGECRRKPNVPACCKAANPDHRGASTRSTRPGNRRWCDGSARAVPTDGTNWL
jgi:hypothetical protein